jgi:hypothetical protein
MRNNTRNLNPEPESNKLTLVGGEFRLGGYAPAIFFDPQGCTIGCKKVSAAAMDKLADEWQKSRRQSNTYKVIQKTRTQFVK